MVSKDIGFKQVRIEGFGIVDLPEEIESGPVEAEVKDINKEVNESALAYIIPISITVGVTLALLTLGCVLYRRWLFSERLKLFMLRRNRIRNQEENQLETERELNKQADGQGSEEISDEESGNSKRKSKEERSGSESNSSESSSRNKGFGSDAKSPATEGRLEMLDGNQQVLVNNEVVIDCSDADNELDLAETERQKLMPGQNINSDETHERNATDSNNILSPKLSGNFTPIQKDDISKQGVLRSNTQVLSPIAATNNNELESLQAALDSAPVPVRGPRNYSNYIKDIGKDYISVDTGSEELNRQTSFAGKVGPKVTTISPSSDNNKTWADETTPQDRNRLAQMVLNGKSVKQGRDKKDDTPDRSFKQSKKSYSNLNSPADDNSANKSGNTPRDSFGVQNTQKQVQKEYQNVRLPRSDMNLATQPEDNTPGMSPFDGQLEDRVTFDKSSPFNRLKQSKSINKLRKPIKEITSERSQETSSFQTEVNSDSQYSQAPIEMDRRFSKKKSNKNTSLRKPKTRKSSQLGQQNGIENQETVDSRDPYFSRRSTRTKTKDDKNQSMRGPTPYSMRGKSQHLSPETFRETLDSSQEFSRQKSKRNINNQRGRNMNPADDYYQKGMRNSRSHRQNVKFGIDDTDTADAADFEITSDFKRRKKQSMPMVSRESLSRSKQGRRTQQQAGFDSTGEDTPLDDMDRILKKIEDEFKSQKQARQSLTSSLSRKKSYDRPMPVQRDTKGLVLSPQSNQSSWGNTVNRYFTLAPNTSHHEGLDQTSGSKFDAEDGGTSRFGKQRKSKSISPYKDQTEHHHCNCNCHQTHHR